MIRTMTWIAVVAAIALGLVGAAPTGAATDIPTAVVSPAVAHAGETVTISGVGCPQPGWTSTGWQVKATVGPPGGPPGAGEVTDPDPSGSQTPIVFAADLLPQPSEIELLPVTGDSWEWLLEIPGDWPPGVYPVSASCIGEFTEDGFVSFAGAELVVEEAPAATTTTAPHPPAPPSPPAAPVPESPAFTG